jgi:hypothetical protein
MKLTVLLWAVLLAISSNELLAQPWSDLTSYTFERTASVRDPGLVFDGWKVTSRKVISFTEEGGTVTYYQGVSSTGTNNIRQVSFIRIGTSEEWRVITHESYYNRYATGGMLTNIISDVIAPQLIPPTEDWLIGTQIRTTDTHKVTDTGTFTIRYDNTNSLSPWVIRHGFVGNKGSFDLTIRVAAKGVAIFSPGLKDAKKESGKNYSYAYYETTVSWIPWDEIPLWKKNRTYLYNH